MTTALSGWMMLTLVLVAWVVRRKKMVFCPKCKRDVDAEHDKVTDEDFCPNCGSYLD